MFVCFYLFIFVIIIIIMPGTECIVLKKNRCYYHLLMLRHQRQLCLLYAVGHHSAAIPQPDHSGHDKLIAHQHLRHATGDVTHHSLGH